MGDLAVVTGGAGFIGSHLVDALAKEGFRVRVIDDLSSGSLDNLQQHEGSGQVEFCLEDIRHPDKMHRALEGARFVFHEAARTLVPFSIDHPNVCLDVNVMGSLNVLRAAKEAGVERVVYASSSSVYGDDLPLPTSERVVPRPVSPYAVSKLAAEHLCAAWSTCFDLPTVALRYFNVYGPRQRVLNSTYGLVIPKFLDLMRRGEAPTIYGDGAQTRDFTHVSDVVAANMSAMTCSVPPEGFTCNIGSGTSVSILELVEVLNTALGTNIEPVLLPERNGDVRDTWADITAAAVHFLDWMPEMDLFSGLTALAREAVA